MCEVNKTTNWSFKLEIGITRWSIKLWDLEVLTVRQTHKRRDAQMYRQVLVNVNLLHTV